MYVRAKKIAILGLFIALNMLLLFLSSVWEFNTLFILAAASFTVGIAVREYGFRLGFGYYIANILLGFIIAPNKYYCFTLAGMGIYIFLTELLFFLFMKTKAVPINRIMLLLAKVIIFNCFYIPVLVITPKLVYSGTLHAGIMALLVLGGQAVLVIYDFAYHYFMDTIWVKFSKYMR